MDNLRMLLPKKVTDNDECDWTDVIRKEFDVDDRLSDYEEVSYDLSQSDFPDYMNVAHAMIYAKDPENLSLDDNARRPKHAAIMMQMRFDGKLGFPGGVIDHAPEKPVQGLNRELHEEINLDLTRHQFSHPKHHVITHVRHDKNVVLHFYAQEVTLEEFSGIERSQLQADEWGMETFGMLRVPLYTVRGTPRGFPVFLTNRFAGNAKLQLLHSIQKFDLLPSKELNRMMEMYVNYTEQMRKENKGSS